MKNLKCSFHRIERTKKLQDRLGRCNKKKYGAKKNTMQENLNIGKKVLLLAKIVRKKLVPDKFYNQTDQTIPYFNKNGTSSEINKNTNFLLLKTIFFM